VEDFIAAFERLDFRTEGMSNVFFRECFISGLKEEIRAHVLMAQPQSWVDGTKITKEAQHVVSSQNQKPFFIARTKLVTPTPPSTPLKIQKLTRAKIVERQIKGLCYNCDDKYFPGHKCKEQKLFMAISEDVLEEDVEALLFQMEKLVKHALLRMFQMEKLVKKGHSGIIAQLHAIQATETRSVPQGLQFILSKHQVVFSTPQGLPPSCGVHDHSIPLDLGILPPNICPYRHPFSQKNKIEKIVQELLNVGVIRPSTSP
jgi:hypothetical protein